MCACACVPVYILPASVHADLHVCTHVCTHVCRPEVGIHALLDHSPPVCKVRGGVSHLNPDLTDTPSLASHLNPGGLVSSSYPLGLWWVTMPYWHFYECWRPRITVGQHALLAFVECWTLIFTLVRQILFLLIYLPSLKSISTL